MLYHIRTRCNYTQGMLARELDVSRQALCAWENGRKSIPQKRATQLAELFGIEPEILLHGDVQELENRTLFSLVKQGRQVFSYRPQEQVRVFFQDTTEDLPEQRSKNLALQRKALLEQITALTLPDQEKQVEQAPQDEKILEILRMVCHMLSICLQLPEESQTVALTFLAEQLSVMEQLLSGKRDDNANEWQSRQLQQLRSRWASMLLQSQENNIPSLDHIVWDSDRKLLTEQLNTLYRQALASGIDRQRLRLQVNRYLEEKVYETAD